MRKSKHSHKKCGHKNGNNTIYKRMFKLGFAPTLIARIFKVSHQAVYTAVNPNSYAKALARNKRWCKEYRNA